MYLFGLPFSRCCAVKRIKRRSAIYRVFQAFGFTACLVGCAANDSPTADAVGMPPPPAASASAPSPSPSPAAFAPNTGSHAALPQPVTQPGGTGEPAPNNAAEAKQLAVRPPARRAVQHFTSFYTPEVAVYDRPYGAVRQRIPEKSLPREATNAGDGAQGVPIYDSKNAFVEVGLPGGDTGWITIDSGRITAKSCELSGQTARQQRGPVGAGSSDVTCVEKKSG
jgi:hypothetical protein